MDFVYKGKFIRKSTKTRNQKKAEKIYHSVMGKILDGIWFDRLPGEEKTFREMMKKYMAEHSLRSKRASSHRRDKSLAAHLLKSFGESIVTMITPKDISQYKNRASQK